MKRCAVARKTPLVWENAISPACCASLDPRQRKALELFEESAAITSGHLEQLSRISQRAARNLFVAWVETGFVVVADPAKKTRKYALSADYATLLKFR